MSTVVEEAKPEVVSFHFGLPDPALLARVKAAGCRVMSSATTVAEALWLEARGVDVIIAQGYEAGGHRGMFLAPNLNGAIASQPGTLALVPQVVDAVSVPVVAAGGIANGRGIATAFALGREMPAEALTLKLVEEAMERFNQLHDRLAYHPAAFPL
jgi:nitronate monooxygenase